MNYLAIVGTNSDVSTNRMLLQFMQKHFASEAQIDLFEIKDLPAFIEKDELEDAEVDIPVKVQDLLDQISKAKGVIIATPEYDHAIPAVLKSALEWISYTTQTLKDKPVLIVGASHGALGSSRAQAHLRQILDSPELGARMMPSSEFLWENPRVHLIAVVISLTLKKWPSLTKSSMSLFCLRRSLRNCYPKGR